MSFGSRLRQARLDAGLSQAELGGDEFTVSYVSHLEAGRREPSARVTEVFEQRLALPRGYLSGEDWGRTGQEDEASLSTADLAALASRVRRSMATAPSPQVARLAHQAAEEALRLDRSETWWAMSLVEVRAQVRAGAYAEASRTATSLTEHPWVRSQPMLLTEAHTVASKACRRAVDRTGATHHAHAALEASSDGLGDPGLRAEAVIAAIATAAIPVDPLVAELETLHHRLAGSHLAGLAAWTLGNEAFNAGDVATGLVWHQTAMRELNPDVDHRDWARFVATTCLQRVRHGLDDDVADLLDIARQHLALLGTTEELADLACTEAQWHQRAGRHDAALSALEQAFALADLPDLSRGRLHLAAARVHESRGDLGAATDEALSAARLLTLAGDGPGAREAWEIHDAAGTSRSTPLATEIDPA